MDKKKEFLYIIASFHERILPKIYHREFDIPEINKVIALTGVRRSGKTFTIYQEINKLLEANVPLKNILYINYEDDRLKPLQLENLQNILDAYYELYPELSKSKKYFFFDEIQEIEDWEKFIRRLIDTEDVKIYITGSSSKLLSYDISSTLRGRSISVNVLPLSFQEYLYFHSMELDHNFEFTTQRYAIKKYFTEYTEYGGFPEVVLALSNKWEILKDYYDLLVYRDIVDRYSVRNTLDLKMLLKYLLTNIGNLFSINRYSKLVQVPVNISKNTIHEYFSYLTESKIIYAIPIFSYSVKAQQVNPVKIYCVDNGIRKVVAFQFSTDEGRLIENTVYLHLLRYNKEVFYWKGKNEVDFIIKELDGSLIALNVTCTDDMADRELSGLEEVKTVFPIKKSLLLTKDTKKTFNEIECVPVWSWLLTFKGSFF